MRFLILALLSTNVFPSSFEECTFRAELKLVEKEYQQVLLVKLTDERGHIGQCRRFLGSKRIKIKDFGKYRGPKDFKLKYSNYSGMGPNGPVSSKSWTIVPAKK